MIIRKAEFEGESKIAKFPEHKIEGRG